MKRSIYIISCQNKSCRALYLTEKEKTEIIEKLFKYNVFFQIPERCPKCFCQMTENKDFFDKKLLEELTFKEFKILNVFLESTHRSATRNDLIEALWGKIQVGPKTLDVHLFNLRKKLRIYKYDLIHKGSSIWSLERVIK